MCSGVTKMEPDELLRLFHSLMKRKNQRKLSGAYEAKAYKEEARRLKEHYEFALSFERRVEA